jgi:hypothetical protein
VLVARDGSTTLSGSARWSTRPADPTAVVRSCNIRKLTAACAADGGGRVLDPWIDSRWRRGIISLIVSKR